MLIELLRKLKSTLLRLGSLSKLSLLVAVISVASGLSLTSSALLVLTTVIVAWPGVMALRACLVTEHEPVELILLGAPFGLTFAVLSQQLLLATGVTQYGWVAPAVIASPFLRRRSESSHINPINWDQFVILFSAAAFVLADVNWAFIIAGAVSLIALKTQRTWKLVVVVLGMVMVRLLLDPFWYLISDDRLFEEAYSIFIQRFGFWSWYGASDTWVPYHWFGHAVGGLLQSTMQAKQFQAVGAGVQVVNALLVASSIFLLMHRRKLHKTAVGLGVACTPLFGIFALGESNSADLSIGLGLWSIALSLVILRSHTQIRFGPMLLVFATGATSLAKVSTGVIVGLGLVVLFVFLDRTSYLERKWIWHAVCCLGSLTAVLLFNYDIAGLRDIDDSRTSFKITLGGSILNSDISLTFRLIAVFVLFVSGVFLPTLLFFAVLRRGAEGRIRLVLALTLLAMGWGTQLVVESYNNESFLEAAVLCSIPLMLSVLLELTDADVSRRLLSLLGLAGSLFGVLQVALLKADSGLMTNTALRFIGRGPLLLGIGSLLVVLIVLRCRQDRVIPRLRIASLVVSILVAASFMGSDIYRVISQVQHGDVWAATNFGESDRFFFGSDDEIAAAKWLRENSVPSDIVATNRLCKIDSDCSWSGQSPIAAWTQRRTFIEAERFIVGRRVDEIPIGSSNPLGHPKWVVERKSVSHQYGKSDSTDNETLLRNQSVKWFWYDNRVSPAPTAGYMRFQSGPILIFEIS